MKKQILLSAILSLATCNMFAADLTVTSASGDPSVEGSFPNIMASAQTDDVIKFNLATDDIEEFDAVTIDSKSLNYRWYEPSYRKQNKIYRCQANIINERSLHDYD